MWRWSKSRCGSAVAPGRARKTVAARSISCRAAVAFSTAFRRQRPCTSWVLVRPSRSGERRPGRAALDTSSGLVRCKERRSRTGPSTARRRPRCRRPARVLASLEIPRPATTLLHLKLKHRSNNWLELRRFALESEDGDVRETDLDQIGQRVIGEFLLGTRESKRRKSRSCRQT